MAAPAGTATTVAGTVAAGLAAAGVEVVFCFPGGGSNLALVDALGEEGVRVALARSEGGGGLAAAALGELTGTPGVVVTGIGPGVASVVNAAAHAQLDRAPLLVVTDRYSAAEAATNEHQLIDHQALLAPVTKWQATVEPGRAAEIVARALALATEPPCGAVHLEIARDAAAAEGGAPVAPRVREPERRRPDLRAAGTLLGAAGRPAVVVGVEAVRAVPQDELVALAETLRAPVLTTFKAKGAFPEHHPLYAGVCTAAEIEGAVLGRADALLAVGLDPVELLPRPWPFAAPLVSLRAHPRGDAYLSPAQAATGELGGLVRALLEALPERRSEWSEHEVAGLWQAALERLRVPAEGPLASWQAVEAVQAEAPPGTTVAIDAGAHMFAAVWFWRSRMPGRFLISNGLATMGFAVPAALAAALARPGEPAIAFTGDGGFLLHGAELETAVRLGARIVVVVLDDANLSLIRIKQEDRGLERAAVDFGPVAFDRLAESLGARGVRAESGAELRAAVRAALGAPASTVVHVPVPGGEYRELVRRVRG